MLGLIIEASIERVKVLCDEVIGLVCLLGLSSRTTTLCPGNLPLRRDAERVEDRGRRYLQLPERLLIAEAVIPTYLPIDDKRHRPDPPVIRNLRSLSTLLALGS